MFGSNSNPVSVNRSDRRSTPKRLPGFAILLLVLIGCEAKPQPKAATNGNSSIGVATMSADGTILLTLRAEEEGGTAIGDAQLLYPTDHEEYETILEHIGGIEPGQEKTVAPWDQKQADN